MIHTIIIDTQGASGIAKAELEKEIVEFITSLSGFKYNELTINMQIGHKKYNVISVNT